MFNPRSIGASTGPVVGGWQRLAMLSLALAIAFGAHLPMPEAALAAPYETTANLNIRAEPDPAAPVIGGIPGGGTVEVTGELQNGFYPVTYNGVSGFASADYLVLSGGGVETAPEEVESASTDVETSSVETAATGPTGTRYVEARLNLRSGPATSYGVIAVMPAGAAVELTGEIANGFSQLSWNGNTGWAATEYLATEGGASEPTPAPEEPTATPPTPTDQGQDVPPVGDTPIGTATVSTVGLSLNMRSGPSISYGVVRSIPSGAQVELMGEAQNGFRPVRYQGTTGWASADYLRVGGTSTPVTPTATATTPATTAPPDQAGGGAIGDTVTGSATVTTVGLSLNMRSGPGLTFGVIRSIPSGAQVDVMGAAQAGFLPVRYQGTKGWASTDYLRTGSGGTATATAPATSTPATPTATATTTPDGNATGSGTVTAGRLNFRSGPGMASPVIGVLTFGTQVEITGSAQNGFLPIQAQGRSGWASAEFIDVGSGNSPTPTVTSTPVTPTATPATPSPTSTPATPSPSPTIPPGGTIGTAVVSVTGTLNMRSGPGLEYPVIRGLANGTQVDLLGAAQNGFRPIRVGGTEGWASEAYLEIGATNPGGPSEPDVPAIGNAAVGKATMNTTVSLRRGPATSYGHIQTLNTSWKVEVMGDPVNGWTPIRYNAAKGWVPSSSLNPGWGYQIVDQMITSRALRLTSQPGGGTLVIMVPPGTLVDITGPAQGTYVPASWAGRRGWLDSSTLYQPESFVEPGPANARQAEMISLIYQAADKWGQNRADMLRVARCESNLDPRAVNPASGTSGLFQFMPSTFAFTPNGKRGEDIFDPWSNADAAGWMWANGMRHHWACQ